MLNRPYYLLQQMLGKVSSISDSLSVNCSDRFIITASYLLDIFIISILLYFKIWVQALLIIKILKFFLCLDLVDSDSVEFVSLRIHNY